MQSGPSRPADRPTRTYPGIQAARICRHCAMCRRYLGDSSTRKLNTWHFNPHYLSIQQSACSDISSLWHSYTLDNVSRYFHSPLNPTGNIVTSNMTFTFFYLAWRSVTCWRFFMGLLRLPGGAHHELPYAPYCCGIVSRCDKPSIFSMLWLFIPLLHFVPIKQNVH